MAFLLAFFSLAPWVGYRRLRPSQWSSAGAMTSTIRDQVALDQIQRPIRSTVVASLDDFHEVRLERESNFSSFTTKPFRSQALPSDASVNLQRRELARKESKSKLGVDNVAVKLAVLMVESRCDQRVRNEVTFTLHVPR